MRKVIYLFVVCFVMNACNTRIIPIYFENRLLSTVTIEILEPAELTIEKNIGSIHLAKPSIPNEDIKVILTYLDTSDTLDGNINNDMVDNMYGALADYLTTSPRFLLTGEQETVPTKQGPQWLFYDTLAYNSGADAIFILEKYDAKYRFFTSDQFSFSEEVYLFKAYLQIDVTSTWSFYSPVSRKYRKVTVTHEDKYEGGTAAHELDAFETLPPLREIILYDAWKVGKTCATKISPYWITVDRGIYAKGSRQLRKAKRMITEQNDWEGAMKIWQSNINDDNIILAKHSRYNLVVAEEVLGNIQKAIAMGERYNAEYNDPHMERYLRVMKERYRKKLKLDEQFHVE